MKSFRDLIYEVQDSAFSFTNRELAVKTESMASQIAVRGGDISTLTGKDTLKTLMAIEQDATAKRQLIRKLSNAGIDDEQIDKIFKDLYNKDNLERVGIAKVTKPQNDAYIHKSGKVVPISEDDNIVVRKDMKKVNAGEHSQNNKQLMQTINNLQATIDKLTSALDSDKQKIVLTDFNGAYVAKGFVDKARGNK